MATKQSTKTSSESETMDEFIKSKPLVTEYSVRIYDEIVHDIGYYIPLLELLSSASSLDIINVHLCTPGGSLSAGQLLLQAIKESDATVHMIVEGHACSMGALLALSGDNLTFKHASYLMFHTFSGGERGKSNEMDSSLKSSLKSWTTLLQTYCTPFLTKKEINQLLDGKDLYFHPEDKETELKLKKHFKVK